MAKPINIMAGLRKLERTSKKTGKTSAKFVMEIRTEDLWFDPSEREFARALALGMANDWRENILRGKRPDGKGFPSLAKTTLAHRAETRRRARKGFTSQSERRRYKAPRGVETVEPGQGTTFARDSGILARSIKARPLADGSRYHLYVSANRANPPRGGGPSALETVFAGRPGFGPRNATSQNVNKTMQEAIDGSMSKQRSGLFKALGKSAKSAGDVFAKAEEAAEE